LKIFFIYVFLIALIAATPASLTCTTSLEPGAVPWERQGAVATTQLVSRKLMFDFLMRNYHNPRKLAKISIPLEKICIK
jgi:hypothetical protein